MIAHTKPSPTSMEWYTVEVDANGSDCETIIVVEPGTGDLRTDEVCWGDICIECEAALILKEPEQCPEKAVDRHEPTEDEEYRIENRPEERAMVKHRRHETTPHADPADVSGDTLSRLIASFPSDVPYGRKSLGAQAAVRAIPIAACYAGERAPFRTTADKQRAGERPA